MALTPDQSDWLNRFTRGKALPALHATADPVAKDRALLDDDEVRCQTMKEAEIERSTAAIGDAKAKLQAALDLQFQVNGKDTRTRDVAGRQHKEFDSEESSAISTPLQDDSGKATAFGKKLLKANNQMKPLAEESERLRNCMVKRHVADEKTKALAEREVALFSDEEIMREFYTPLVRELIIPENFVPDRYSATKKMVDESNDYYIEECKAKGKAPERGLASFGKGVVNVASVAVTAAFGLETDKALITEGVALAIGTGIDAVSTAVDAYEDRKFDQNSWKVVANGFASAVGKIIGGAQGDTFGGDFYGQILTASIAGTDAYVHLGRWVVKGGKFPAAELAGSIADAVSAAASAKSDKASGEDSTNATIVASAVGAFSSSLKGAAGELTGLSKLPPKQWAKSLTKVLLQAACDGAKAFEDDRAAADLNSRDPAPTNEEINARLALAEKAKAGIDDGYDSAAELLAKEEKEDAERRKAEESGEINAAQKQIDAEKKDYQASLDRLGTMDADKATDADFKSVAKLIAKIESDRKILDMAAKVGGMAASIAQEFFAPLKAAGALIQFITNLHAAIERGNALITWMESDLDALVAVSPYATSIQNFVKNQGDQFTHHMLQAALKGLEAASAVAETGYPPLKPLSAGLKGASLLEEAIYNFAQKQKLRRAWKATEQALENTGNRKNGLIARKMNPTLAKYTIAYGAVVEKSPVAIAAMNRCGLDRETLSRTNANVKLVKDYLQTLYVEDGILLGPIPQGPGKKSLPKPALTVNAWLVTLELWREQENLVGDPPREVRILLAKAMALAEIDKDALDHEALGDHLEEHIAALEGLEQAFIGYEPLNATGMPVRDARKALTAYADLAGSQAELLRQNLDVLAGAEK